MEGVERRDCSSSVVVGGDGWVVVVVEVEVEVGGRVEMRGTAKRSRAMPIQRGSQRSVLMVAEARAGPSWREKMEETAFT